jgi:hypothetical protein
MRTRRIHWDFPDVDVTVVIFYEPGSRDEPALAEVEKIYSPFRFPEKDISHVFNIDYVLDRFWEVRPDLEG